MPPMYIFIHHSLPLKYVLTPLETSTQIVVKCIGNNKYLQYFRYCNSYIGGNVAHCSEELEPLTPSRSTERLNREMQNLEGLMKDLSAITQHQFHC